MDVCVPFALRIRQFTDKGTLYHFTTTTTAMDMSHPQASNGWGSPLTEIDPEDSVSNTTLVRAGTPPRGKLDSANRNKVITTNT